MDAHRAFAPGGRKWVVFAARLYCSTAPVVFSAVAFDSFAPGTSQVPIIGVGIDSFVVWIGEWQRRMVGWGGVT